jgi:GT2 family glycosyltransferase
MATSIRLKRFLRISRLAVAAIQVRLRAGGVAALAADARLLLRQGRQALREEVLETAADAPLHASLHAPPAPCDPYEAWIAVNRWTDRDDLQVAQRLALFHEPMPLISVIMPVFDPPPDHLEAAIRSVARQVYPEWELCIADDCSRDPRIRKILTEWSSREPRVRVAFRTENGNISRCTNDAAALATGEYLAFLDNDDELTPDALAEVAMHLGRHPATDVLYSDDDKMTVEGRRYDPQFKPGWSPELLLSYMYLSHLLVVRRSIYVEIGGMRTGFEGSQDYDFALRATERARRVGHLPYVLYHWRAAPGSTATSGGAKPASFDAARRAIQEAFDRRGVPARVEQPRWAIQGSVGIFTHEFADDGPSVAILIPTRNRHRQLKACIDSLRKTTYRDYRVMVLDNGSTDPDTCAYLSQLAVDVVAVTCSEGRFNFAEVMNQGARLAAEDFVLLLNDDTEVIDGRWLSRMVGYGRLPGVGTVGARLLYPDRRVQHAGVVHGYHHGLAGHAFKLAPEWDNGYLSYARVTRNYSAVTAACMLTPRALFLEAGGLDEATFGVAYNDADYCYRLLDRGYRSVYCPGAELLHHEGASRGFNDDPREPAAFRRKYAQFQDPYYSPNLSLQDERFRVQPRRLVRSAPPVRRVACFTNALDFTGAPLHQFELARGLRPLGCHASVVHSIADGPLSTWYADLGIETIGRDHPLALVNGDLDRYDAAIEDQATLLKTLAVDVVYANTLETFYAVDAARRAGIPAVWNVHESEPWQTYFDRFGSGVANRALNCFAYPYRVVFVSDATRDRYLSLNCQHNFAVIHNGLDLARLQLGGGAAGRQASRASLGITDADVVVLLLGTVCERKGQLDLALAVRALPPDVSGVVRCFIVGDRASTYSAQLHAAVEAIDPSARCLVTIVPETPDTALYYQAADIFVCTSRVESFPRVILEAMAYGLPIVTTPVFGITEQVNEGVNGLHYPPGDHQALAQALSTLVRQPELRAAMARRSTHVLNRLNSFEDMVGAYAETFHEAAFSAVAVAGPAGASSRQEGSGAGQ